MSAPLTGYYLNLDRSPDRNAWVRAQLSRLGLGWIHRFPAVDGAQVARPPGCPLLPGEYGCFLSHLRAVEQAPADGWTLILEDDVELSEQLAEVVERLCTQPALDALDVVFLECQPHATLAHVSALWDVVNRMMPPGQAGGARRIRGVELMKGATFYKWACAAYLIPPHARARWLALLRQWLSAGPVHPIDRHVELAMEAGELRGAITVPFLTTTALRWQGHSTIGTGNRAPSAAFMVLRRLLYAGRIDDMQAVAQSLAPPTDVALDQMAAVLKVLAAVQRDEVVTNRQGFFL